MCKRKLSVTQNVDIGGPRELVLLTPRLGSGVVRSQKQPQKGKYQWLRRLVYCAEVLMVSQYNKWMLGSLISKHQELLKLLSGGVSGPIRHGFYSFQISLHLPTLKHEAKERYCSYMKLTFLCFHIQSVLKESMQNLMHMGLVLPDTVRKNKNFF